MKETETIAGERTHWLMQNRRGWGKGATEQEARRNLRKATGLNTTTSEYMIHPSTVIYGDGTWEYPKGFEPKRIK
jgi:hypothetical protein